MGSEDVRAAFRAQAEYCRKLGSPFTALVCDALAEQLTPDSAFGGAILNWPGDPSPLADGVPLRVTGALHALARSGSAPELSSVYPPAAAGEEAVRNALAHVVETCGAQLQPFLMSAPQTSEVGRAGVLFPGWLEVAARTGLPLDLYEIGSSAGLNLIADRYAYRFGAGASGSPGACLQLNPQWEGPVPKVGAPLRVLSRRGCDLQPCDIRDPAHRAKLVAYVWPDQTDRLARLEAAIATALADPPTVDAADAGEWVEARFPVEPTSGVTRVLFHSVTWMYLPASTQSRIGFHIGRAGAVARSDAPVAWLRFEANPSPGLRLTLWPGGEERLLADAHPHGTWVRWREGHDMASQWSS